MPRYVILFHELPPETERASHWDLMLEWQEVLRAWALPREPVPPFDCQAEQLADHRPFYLEYEGAVSGNRGVVARWDEGDYELEQEAADALVVVLHGRRLRGPMTLVRQEPGSHFWRVSFSAEPNRG